MDTQNPTNYAPTQKEKNLLEALMNPENRMKSITDICRIAKCDRSTYYEAFAKPEFVEIYKRESASIVKQSIAPVLNAFVREALRGSFQHGKVLLEMAGVLTELEQHKIQIEREKVEIERRKVDTPTGSTGETGVVELAEVAPDEPDGDPDA